MILHNVHKEKGKNKDLWRAYFYVSLLFKEILTLVKITLLITFIDKVILLNMMQYQNIIKTKYSNRLLTNIVDQLIRVALKSPLIEFIQSSKIFYCYKASYLYGLFLLNLKYNI